ncbi:MAG: hypothetical protein ACR2QB_03550 [Gammaproteobacteria bacterium]
MARRGLLYLLGIIVAALAAVEIYTRLPTGLAEPLNLKPDETRQVVLIFHGSLAGGDPILDDIANRFVELAALDSGTVVVNYRWDDGADQRLRAAASGRRLGTALGTELGSLPKLESVRIITHSVGAFVADALCESLREKRSTPWIEMTFLDPFGILGFIDWRFGVRNHGHCADFAVAFINRDDATAASNSPLAQAYNRDVTASPRRELFLRSGHYWPLRYYADFIDLAEVTPGIRTHDDYPRGDLRTLTD